MLELAMEKRTLRQMSKSCGSKGGTQGHLQVPKSKGEKRRETSIGR